MTILNFMNHIKYDKAVAMSRCLENEIWATMVTSLRENYLNCVSFDENDKERVEFIDFISNNGFIAIKRADFFLPGLLNYDITVSDML